MKNIIKVIFLFSFILSLIIAQSSVDVLHLKNGDIIKGSIIENKINEYIRIELQGGSILTYKYNQIESIEKEETKGSIKVVDSHKETNNYFNVSNDAKIHARADYSGKVPIGPFIGTAVGAFLLSPLLGGTAGVLLSYISSGSNAQVPSHRLAEIQNNNYSSGDISLYTSSYLEEAKSVLKTQALSGSAAGCATIWLINIAIISSSSDY